LGAEGHILINWGYEQTEWFRGGWERALKYWISVVERVCVGKKERKRETQRRMRN